MLKRELRAGLITYLVTWVAVFLFVTISIMARGQSAGDAITLFSEIILNTAFLAFTHIVFGIFYIIFLLFRYFRRVQAKRGTKKMLKRLSLRFVLPLVIIYSGYQMLMSHNLSESYDYIWDGSVENETGFSNDYFLKDGKHRGLSVFGWSRDNEQAVDDILRTNTEWVAVVPFLYQEDERTKKVNTPEAPGTWTRRDSSFIRAINDLHEKGIHVQLKPHLWMSSGWRAKINLPSPKDWDIWFDSYRINMMHYAKLAQETGVELLCIGTELETSIENNSEDWVTLVSEIKKVYKGKLTYASNWDGEFRKVPFWDQMDYIGIQAYFPLTENKNPLLEEIQEGWKDHIVLLEEFSNKYKKPILFTEVGYKSESTATIKPWEWHDFGGHLSYTKSFETQKLAYEALFEELWEKDWFAGIYVWEWDTRSSPDRADENLNFSVRFKPAENTITKWFGQKTSKLDF